jgi:acetyl esterase/lipase
MTASYAVVGSPSDVTISDYQVTVGDGSIIAARLYKPTAASKGGGVIYLHGGGMICGSVDIYDPMIRHYADLSGVPFLSVDYRLAPEYVGTRPAQDCFDVTRWFYENAEKFHVDPNRIAVMGDSAGGGLAASVAIQARDAGIHLARQILIYPMLDDRNTTPRGALELAATWSYDDNFTGWNALLGTATGGDSVSPTAAPARLADFEELAPAYVEVGELDIFRAECVAYATSLAEADVSCELHVHPGAPHGYEWIAPESELFRRVIAERMRVVRSL